MHCHHSVVEGDGAIQIVGAEGGVAVHDRRARCRSVECAPDRRFRATPSCWPQPRDSAMVAANGGEEHMPITTRTPPAWFWIVAVLLLWNLIGAYACIQQFRLGADAMGPATEYDRALYASMPVWYNWVFAAAEVTGIGGALALLASRAWGAAAVRAIADRCRRTVRLSVRDQRHCRRERYGDGLFPAVHRCHGRVRSLVRR